MNIERFLARFPEFDEDYGCTDRGFISFMLDVAAIELKQRGWVGNLFEEGVLFLAADKFMHFWFDIPQDDFFGPAMKTAYAIEFERLASIHDGRLGVMQAPGSEAFSCGAGG